MPRRRRKIFKIVELGFYIIAAMLIYTSAHEYAHMCICAYYGGIPTRISFSSVFCSINSTKDPGYMFLNSLNEVIASVIFYINVILFYYFMQKI